MKHDRARQILLTLMDEVKNPDIANHTAAMRAVMDAEILFKEEGHALQKPSATAEIPRASEAGEDEARGPERVGKRHPGRPKAPRKSATSPADPQAS